MMAILGILWQLYEVNYDDCSRQIMTTVVANYDDYS